ncbi:MAG: galactose mutarotase [Clostridia bacterium]|nr:galactose mutarotase [Clostridia bacterium]
MITKEVCGQINGRDIYEFTLQNENVTLQVMEYGATVHRLLFSGVDCVAGYDELQGYMNGNSFQGATVGRYANRIGGAAFSVNGECYKVDANDNKVNSLHGGAHGFYAKVFQGEEIDDHTVAFSLFSPHLEGGYPGNLNLTVTFCVENNGVTITYDALCDRDTVMNFTNHAYFTLGADRCKNIVLQMQAEAITPVDDLLIPTGEYMAVEGTPFDFRIAKPIGQDLEKEHPQLLLGGGYDHNFVLGKTKQWREAVITATNPQNGITLTCSTDLPGVQLYTSNMLNEPLGKEGSPLSKHQAFCLETQFFPDTPNQPEFPSCEVKAEQPFTSVTRYEFQ